MKLLIPIAFFAVVVHALPNPSYVRYAAVPVATQSTYHAQDEFGQYSFGYHEPNQVRSETKDAFGIIRGSYSYAGADGNIITNNYIADENGFRSSLAPANGPILPLVGKAPKAAISHAPVTIAAAPIHVAAPPVAIAPAPVAFQPAPIAKVEKPTVVKFAGGHVAPLAPTRVAVSPYAYGYPSYHYAAYAPYASVVRSW